MLGSCFVVQYRVYLVATWVEQVFVEDTRMVAEDLPCLLLLEVIAQHLKCKWALELSS